MTPENFCKHLATVVAAAAAEQRLEILANELAGFFDVQPHEVGLFRMDSAGRCATFVWPPHRLSHDVKIPIKSFFTSLVSTTARQRSGSIDNAFAGSTHLHMFEHSLADREQCVPLQKVMTAPGFDDTQLRWVVQISRKGKTLSEAGPDFTVEQLQKLETLAQFLVSLPL